MVLAPWVLGAEKASKLAECVEPVELGKWWAALQIAKCAWPAIGSEVCCFTVLQLVLHGLCFCCCCCCYQGNGELQLLHNITGSFRPGVLTALMGVSGAGKVRAGQDGFTHHAAQAVLESSACMLLF